MRWFVSYRKADNSGQYVGCDVIDRHPLLWLDDQNRRLDDTVVLTWFAKLDGDDAAVVDQLDASFCILSHEFKE